jgi:hypothetical protein
MFIWWTLCNNQVLFVDIIIFINILIVQYNGFHSDIFNCACNILCLYLSPFPILFSFSLFSMITSLFLLVFLVLSYHFNIDLWTIFKTWEYYFNKKMSEKHMREPLGVKVSRVHLWICLRHRFLRNTFCIKTIQ